MVKKIRKSELLAAAAVVLVLAVFAASGLAAELPPGAAQEDELQASREGHEGLFQSPLMTVGGYNGQPGPYHSPLAAGAQLDGQPDDGAASNQLIPYYAFLPWVARYGSDSVSSTIFLHNVSYGTPASVMVSFYDEAGVYVDSLIDVVPANGTAALEQATMAGLPVGYEGGALIESDAPVMAVVNLVPGTRDRLLTYNGVTAADSDLVLPMVTRNANGSTTSFWVQNTGTSAGTLEISYLPYGGGPGCTDTISNVPSLASLTFDGGDASCIGDGFFGLVTIQASRPVAAVAAVWQLAGNGAAAYGAHALPASLQVPAYRQLVPRQDRKSLSDWTSGVLMANVGVMTGTMQSNWYHGDGSGPWSDHADVGVGAKVEYDLSPPGLVPDGFDGSLVVEADQPFALVSSWANANDPGDGFAMNPGIPASGSLLASAGGDVHLPRVAHGLDRSTQLSIQNAATLSATALVTITYHEQGGAATAVVGDAIPYQGVKRYSTLSVPELGSEWQGSATIESTQPIAAEAVQFLYFAPQSTCPVVSSPADSGLSTLRDCLGSASSGDTIVFDTTVFPPGAPATISVGSQLPALLQGNVTVNASNAGVVIDGSQTHTDTSTVGLWIGSDSNVVKGLQIVNFPSAAIRIKYAGYNVIGGDNTAGAGPVGEGNVLSGNWKGVYIDGTGAVSNTILGNFMGVGASGTVSLPNEYQGIAVYEGADYTTIGSTTPGQGNVIAGNERTGILIWSDHNVVAGNLIGLDATGTSAVPNDTGIQLNTAAANNLIRDNVISGNLHYGVSLSDPGTMHNTIAGNLIGTDGAGTAAIGNGEIGVFLYGGASLNTVGGDTPDERNVISGNEHDGIKVRWDDAGYNTISGNYVGLDASGTYTLPNAYYGIGVESSFNTIGGSHGSPGGACSGECNVISGNCYGLQIVGSSAMSNTVTGNHIGTDATGTTAWAGACGPHSNGVYLGHRASYNRVGGATGAERNVIAGSVEFGPPTSRPRNNEIVGNYIGVDATGTTVLARGYHGIGVAGAENVIGRPGGGNVIAGFDHSGVSVSGWGNYIGFNEIYGNAEHGVRVKGTDALTNTIMLNSIHDNVGQGIKLEDGGNDELPAPVISSTDMAAGVASGTACALCMVEVFSDGEDEGETYEGSALADGGGVWNLNAGAPFTGPQLTATVTDGDGNTSEFGLYIRYVVYLPVMLRSAGAP